MGLTTPFGVTGIIMRQGGGNNMMCLVLDEVSSVHLGSQLVRLLHVLGE